MFKKYLAALLLCTVLVSGSSCTAEWLVGREARPAVTVDAIMYRSDENGVKIPGSEFMGKKVIPADPGKNGVLTYVAEGLGLAGDAGVPFAELGGMALIGLLGFGTRYYKKKALYAEMDAVGAKHEALNIANVSADVLSTIKGIWEMAKDTEDAQRLFEIAYNQALKLNPKFAASMDAAWVRRGGIPVEME